MKLDEIRKKISQIDFEIVKRLHERMELALRTKHFKLSVTDKEREIRIWQNIGRFSGPLIGEKFSKKLFRNIIGESKRLQNKSTVLIGFQGEHGSNSEVAAQLFNPGVIPIPCREFADVFAEVKNNSFDLGILPVENSLEGSVTEVNDLLVSQDLLIVGEMKLPISHCLLTLPETDYREIKIVYSHPQALSQCREFILRNKLEPRPFYDTAGAAKMLAKNRPNATAAIASKACEKYYDLKIIKEDIQDEKSNLTRFLVLSKAGSKENGNKCSIIFSVNDEAGALCRVLKIFSDQNINMTRIESRPSKKIPGTYIFLADFTGSIRDKTVSQVLEKIEQETQMYKFLGCYKEALP
jgi:prephenate dehydratase/chorismate mutase/prephenate dehydratase